MIAGQRDALSLPFCFFLFPPFEKFPSPAAKEEDERKKEQVLFFFLSTVKNMHPRRNRRSRYFDLVQKNRWFFIRAFFLQSYSMDCYFRQSWVDRRLAFSGQKNLALSIEMLRKIWQGRTKKALKQFSAKKVQFILFYF